MNADIRAFGLVRAGSSYSEVTFLLAVCCARSRGGGRAVGRLDLLVGVIDQVFFGRHGDIVLGGERRVRSCLRRKAEIQE